MDVSRVLRVDDLGTARTESNGTCSRTKVCGELVRHFGRFRLAAGHWTWGSGVVSAEPTRGLCVLLLRSIPIQL